MRLSLTWRSGSQLSALALIDILVGASTFSSLGVVLPFMVKELAWNWSQAGVGFTLLGACCGGSAWLPPKVIRRFGVRANLVLGAILMALGLFGLSQAHGLIQYFVSTALCGVSYQLMANIPATFVITRLFPERPGSALGIYGTIGGLGNVLGPWMALSVIGATDGQWRIFWTMQAVLLLVLGVACALVVGLDSRFRRPASEELKSPPRTRRAQGAGNARVYRTPESWSVKAAMATPQFYALMFSYFAAVFCLVTVTAFSVGHLTERGVSPGMAGAMLSLEGLVAVVTRASGGFLADRFDPRVLATASIAAMSAGCLLLTFGQTQPWLLFYALGTGIGFGLTQLCCTVLMLNYYGERHNLELFSTMLLVGTVSATGPVLGGIIRDLSGSFTGVFLLNAVASGVGAVLFLLMRPPEHAADKSAAPAAPLPGLIAGAE
jgi:MFS family permease